MKRAGIALVLSLLLLQSCQSRSSRHVVIGSWQSGAHALRLYPDNTASYDGIAAAWKPLSDNSATLDLNVRGAHAIWEFRVEKVAPMGPAELAAIRRADSLAWSPTWKIVPGEAVTDPFMIEEINRLGFAQKLQKAKENGEATGRLLIGATAEAFVREP